MHNRLAGELILSLIQCMFSKYIPLIKDVYLSIIDKHKIICTYVLFKVYDSY